MNRIDYSTLPYPKPAPRQKRERPGNDRDHLKNVRLLPCLACGRGPVQAHHLLKTGEQKTRGIRRNADRWAVPLCARCHDPNYTGSLHHSGDEVRWFSERGIDQIAVAEALWRRRGRLGRMLGVIDKARMGHG